MGGHRSCRARRPSASEERLTDGPLFDDLTLRLGTLFTRRRLSATLGVLGLGAGFGLVAESGARKKKKKKKKCKHGTSKCGGSCVNTQTNKDHCGTCDNPCADGQRCVSGSCQQTGCDSGEIPCPGGGCRPESQFIGCCVEADCGNPQFSDLTCNLTTHECVCRNSSEGKCGGIFLSQCDPCCPGGSGICNDTVANPRVCSGTTPGACVCPEGTTGACPDIGCVDQANDSGHCGPGCEDCTANSLHKNCCAGGCTYLGGSLAGQGSNSTQVRCGTCDTICGQGVNADKIHCCNSSTTTGDPATATCLSGDQLQGGQCPR